jgi:hypothetical protein
LEEKMTRNLIAALFIALLSGMRGNLNAQDTLFSNILHSSDSASSRNRGIGGGFMPGVIVLDRGPMRDLLNVVPQLQGKSFGRLNSSRLLPVFISGGMGYLGFDNGVRLGGVGMSGERSFTSDIYQQDSIMVMKVSVNYGGFLVDRAVSWDPFMVQTGMVVGGGSLSSSFCARSQNAFSVFSRNTDSTEKTTYTARFFLFELHGSCSYSIASFMHIGANVSLPMFFSADGFDAPTGSFMSANPALQIKLIFGNLG